MFMDTDLEKSIGLAPDYPFEPLAAGECIAPAFYKSKGMLVGDSL